MAKKPNPKDLHTNDLSHRTVARSPQTRIKNATGVPTEDLVRRTNLYFPAGKDTMDIRGSPIEVFYAHRSQIYHTGLEYVESSIYGGMDCYGWYGCS
ncbi:hypothetical protein BGX24_008486 [Mortierella sp. AD032]|nr:hypothetical protein BGX24_008486 [Mortierella sp. AD032]